MRPSKRQELVQKALEVFYSDGFQATGMDGLVRSTGISKTSIYNHFRSKEDLIIAVLRRRDEQFREWLFGRMAELGDDPRAQLLAMFDALAEWFGDADFRGCLFVKAMAEFQDQNHPIHRQAVAHKALLQSQIAGLASAAGSSNTDRLARQLLLLKEGAIAVAQLAEKDKRCQPAWDAKELARELLHGKLETSALPESTLGLASSTRRATGRPQSGRATPEALLFDLGGVIVDVNFARAFEHWAQHGGHDPSSVREAFSEDHAYETHERGEISTNAYFAHLRGTLGLGLSNSRFLQGWNAVLVGLLPGIPDLLSDLSGRVRLFGFSNTNRAHERAWPEVMQESLGHFEKIYASSSIGLRKPDPAAFDHVIADMGLRPGQVVFFDDLLDNIKGAEKSGLRAFHVPTTADLRRALSEMDL